MADSIDKKRWHISREVPLPLIYTIIGQLVVGIAFVYSMGKDTQAAQSKADDHERRITTIEGAKLTERISALEQQMADAKRLMEKMDMKMDRLLERRQ